MKNWSEEEVQKALTRRDNLFDFSRYAVVPNVSWGLRGLNYETDLLCLSSSNIFHEVEIKVTKADLIADKKKRHSHYCKFIQRLWFAIPGNDWEVEHDYYMKYIKPNKPKPPIDKDFAIDNIPEYAGLVIVRRIKYSYGLGYNTEVIRRPRPNKRGGLFKKPEQKIIEKFLRLGVLRMWSSK